MHQSCRQETLELHMEVWVALVIKFIWKMSIDIAMQTTLTIFHSIPQPFREMLFQWK